MKEPPMVTRISLAELRSLLAPELARAYDVAVSLLGCDPWENFSDQGSMALAAALEATPKRKLHSFKSCSGWALYTQQGKALAEIELIRCLAYEARSQLAAHETPEAVFDSQIKKFTTERPLIWQGMDIAKARLVSARQRENAGNQPHDKPDYEQLAQSLLSEQQASGRSITWCARRIGRQLGIPYKTLLNGTARYRKKLSR